ncbi:MAG TPA: Ig-like domain-containing protein [Gemmatimonadaceae bacterium]|nr:Ig-like domain-containing protein [Gemmatimonadaceae bacterium]
MRQLTGAAVVLALAAACASPGPPPGGPVDNEPPRLIGTTPDSGSINVRPDRVLFNFDEVVDERSGGPSLARLFLISPWHGEPDVDWRRRTLAVRPRRTQWRPNTVYTVTLLAGLRDLRGNSLPEGATVVFSTGSIIPDTRLTGVAFDWVAARAIANAMVEVISRPDSTLYVARADSSGRFVLAHLWPGIYTVRAYADPNQNRMLDPREPWDSVQVSLTDTATVDVYAFVRDSVGPGITGTAVRDTITLRATFDRAIDVGQEIGPAQFVLLDPDSVPVPIAEAMRARDWEERERARRDTAPPAVPVTPPGPPGAQPPGAPGARPAADARDTLPFGRPIPATEIVVRLAGPLSPDTQYRLRAIDIRNLAGFARTSERTFRTPRAPPAAEPPAAQPPTAQPPPPPPAGSR